MKFTIKYTYGLASFLDEKNIKWMHHDVLHINIHLKDHNALFALIKDFKQWYQNVVDINEYDIKIYLQI